ncbi:MerR family transcriptional regulator [Bacillus tianshenii]|nr:MerR family transcriptional regulator [Bacillus tianshenii]
MQEVLKTKEVSERLGVAPRTVRKWIKDFNIPCEKNDNGHYLITEEVVERICEMKSVEFEEKSTQEVESVPQEPKEQGVDLSKWFKLVNQLSSRIEDLERQISQKADEVVSVQVLQHRSEIEEVVKRLEKIEEQIGQLEDKQVSPVYHEEVAAAKTSKKSWLTNFLSL